MNVKTPFFVIGTVGMVLTASMHMMMTLFILQTANHNSWLGVYPVFIAFLIIGTFQMIQKNRIIK